MDNSGNNKRIAKNTLLLYVRMILTMAVSLYTSRVLLNTLGIQDFGIFSVVGSIVILFEFINGSMTASTQRFLSFEIGKGNSIGLDKIFSMSINIHVLIAAITLLLAETIGLWFVKTHLTIPNGRLDAALWIYHFSVLSFILTILRVPYNAMIIANEKMQAFAIISVIDVVMKLLIVFILLVIDFDKLKLYGLLVFGATLIISFLYKAYCKYRFRALSYRWKWDKNLFKTLLSFAGWNLWSNIAYIAFTTGINVLLNIFFGPTVNAARGIAYQVNGALGGFVANLRVAMNPQIIKSYATGDTLYMTKLAFTGSKFSFFLLLVLSLPLLIDIDVVLKLWLNIVPEYTALFCRLVIINTMVDCISAPLSTIAQATGKIKVYQITTGLLFFSILPISYLFLQFHFPPETPHYINIFISVVATITQIIMISRLVTFSRIDFLKEVVIPILFVSLLACVLPLFIYFTMDAGFSRFLCITFAAIFSSLSSIYLVGMRQEERQFVKAKMSLIISRTNMK